MRKASSPGPVDRRSFVKQLASVGGAALAAACGGSRLPAAGSAAGAQALARWRGQIGLQLYTVRDLTAKDLPGTLLRVASIGYKEVQPTGSYGAHTPQQVRDMLGRAGVAAPTTHVSPVVGPELERTLAGYQLIGHRYTTIRLPAPPGPRAAPTLDSVKRTAAQLNEAGRVSAKYGIKVMIHNHTDEFAPLPDSPLRPYDVLLAETDPALVTMELDIGWATAAGQDAVAMFRASPGRYEIWHVKDIAQLASLRALGTQAERQRAARIVPVGLGEIDYGAIFAQAQLAGMKHYYVEQDSAPASGDSIAAATTSYRNLMQVLASR